MLLEEYFGCILFDHLTKAICASTFRIETESLHTTQLNTEDIIIITIQNSNVSYFDARFKVSTVKTEHFHFFN